MFSYDIKKMCVYKICIKKLDGLHNNVNYFCKVGLEKEDKEVRGKFLIIHTSASIAFLWWTGVLFWNIK